MTMQWLKASSRYSNGKESDDEYTAIVQKGNMMCSTTSNFSTIPNDAMVTMETCHQWITKETILRSSQVSRELGAVHLFTTQSQHTRFQLPSKLCGIRLLKSVTIEWE